MLADTDRLVALYFEYFRVKAGQRAERKALKTGEPKSVVAAVERRLPLAVGNTEL